MKFSDIHIRAITQEMPRPSITKIHLKITYLKFHSNFPRVNELILLAKTSAHLYSKHSWYSMTHNHAISLGYTVLKFLNALDVLIPNRLVWIKICITIHTAWYIAHMYLLLFDICIWFLFVLEYVLQRQLCNLKAWLQPILSGQCWVIIEKLV